MASKKGRKSSKRSGRAHGRTARNRLKDLLSRMGLARAGLSSQVLDILEQRRYANPAVVVGESVSVTAGVDAAVASVKRAITNATVEIAPRDFTMPLRAFFVDWVMIADSCRGGINPEPRSVSAWSDFIPEVVASYEENVERGLQILSRTVDEALVPHCRFDDVLFWPRYTYGKHDDTARLDVTIEACPGEAHVFTRGGKTRRAFRIGLPFGTAGIDWIRWQADICGGPEGAPPADVYIQTHALEQLRDRLPFERDRFWVLEYTWQSLRAPTLIPHENGWLAEFRIGKWRLGYFVVEEIEDKVLIVTFLFLTMRGTPEGQRLRERLGLRTEDIEWLRMDTLPYFTDSDVHHDSELRTILTECGCGHLFEMLLPLGRVVRLPGWARQTRRHLCMPPMDLDLAAR